MNVRCLSFTDIILILFLSFIVSLPMFVNGGFADSSCYYNQALGIWNHGFISGFKLVFEQTGKFEPFIYFVFYLEGFFIHNEKAFILLNVFLCNLLILNIFYLFVTDENKRYKYIYFFLSIASYFIFSNTMYVWRNIYSIFFLILAIKSDSKKYCLLFFIAAILSNKSAILFIMIYWFCSNTLVFNRTKFILFSILSSIIVYYSIGHISFLSDFVSGGNLNTFLSSNGGDSYQRVIINGYVFAVLLLTVFYKNKKNESIWRFLFLTLCISTCLYFNFQLMWRISVPAMILAPLMIVISENRVSSNKKIGILLLFLSLIPSIRISYMLFNHYFYYLYR
jgi:hypothetical protein